MEHHIQNEFLSVTVSDRGAELQSILGRDGTQYLWQGDPAFWEDRAPTLFPYVGRLTNQSYTYDNKLYHMDIHGFAPESEFTAIQAEQAQLCLRLSDSPETLHQYPFHFHFDVTYTLQASRLSVRYRVENRDTKTMYFALGGHPGFRVPMEDGRNFEDYYLEFSEPCLPDQVQFSKDCFITGEELPYPMENGQILRLRHDMFENDALFFKKTASSVTLSCEEGRHSVTMHHPDFPILGIWHWPHTAAPYVCLEPWSSLPARQGEITDLEQQQDLIALGSGKTHEISWHLDFT